MAVAWARIPITTTSAMIAEQGCPTALTLTKTTYVICAKVKHPSAERTQISTTYAIYAGRLSASASTRTQTTYATYVKRFSADVPTARTRITTVTTVATAFVLTVRTAATTVTSAAEVCVQMKTLTAYATDAL